MAPRDRQRELRVRLVILIFQALKETDTHKKLLDIIASNCYIREPSPKLKDQFDIVCTFILHCENNTKEAQRILVELMSPYLSMRRAREVLAMHTIEDDFVYKMMKLYMQNNR